MPASMISDDSGSRPKVIGSSMAMAGIGPMPGSTPISVPSRQPISAKPTFCQDAAAPKPVARLTNTSTSGAPPDRQRLSQRVGEHADRKGSEAGRQHGRLLQIHVVPRIGGEDRKARGGDRQANSF